MKETDQPVCITREGIEVPVGRPNLLGSTPRGAIAPINGENN